MKINIESAVRFLLSEAYFKEFQVIDGLSQHPDRIRLDDWIIGKGLGYEEKKLTIRDSDLENFCQPKGYLGPYTQKQVDDLLSETIWKVEPDEAKDFNLLELFMLGHLHRKLSQLDNGSMVNGTLSNMGDAYFREFERRLEEQLRDNNDPPFATYSAADAYNEWMPEQLNDIIETYLKLGLFDPSKNLL